MKYFFVIAFLFSPFVSAETETLTFFSGMEMRKCLSEGQGGCTGAFHQTLLKIDLNQSDSPYVIWGISNNKYKIGKTEFSGIVFVRKEINTGFYAIQLKIEGQDFSLSTWLTTKDPSKIGSLEVFDDELRIKGDDGVEYSPDLFIEGIE